MRGLALSMRLLLVSLVLSGVGAAADTVTETYPDGSLLKRFTTDAEGRRHGDYVEFHPGGKAQRVVARYEHGVLEGEYVEKDVARKTTLLAWYLHGELHGPRTTYAEGRPANVERWREGFLYPRTREEIVATLESISGGRTAAEMSTTGQDGALRRLKQHRFAAGVPYDDLVLDDELTELAALGTKLLAETGVLTHHPVNPGWSEELYQRALVGCSGNLAKGRVGPGIVDGAMWDGDDPNVRDVGHRRWCLNPPMRKTGFGQAEGGGDTFGCMIAHDRSGRGRVPPWDVVRFPAGGYMPLSLFARKGYAWSVSLNPDVYRLPKGDSVRVAMRRSPAPAGGGSGRREKPGDRAPVELDLVHVSNVTFGTGGAVVFRPTDLVPKDGDAFRVEITGLMKVDGSAASLAYVTEFFDDAR